LSLLAAIALSTGLTDEERIRTRTSPGPGVGRQVGARCWLGAEVVEGDAPSMSRLRAGTLLVALIDPLGRARFARRFARLDGLQPQAARAWLERHARMLAAVIIVLLAAALLGNGIVLLTRQPAARSRQLADR